MGGRKQSGRRSPQEIRAILSENLKQLVSREPSVSQLCRDLDINRSQFNRYLSGEAYPRPDILEKICAHFDTDARILHRSLDELAEDRRSRLSDEVDFTAFIARIRGFDHLHMADGYYRFVRPSPLLPNQATVSLLLLRSVADGSKRVTAAIPQYGLYGIGGIGPKRKWTERRLRGFAFQHVEGASFLLAGLPGRLLQICYFSGSYLAVGTVYTGYTAFTHTPNHRRAQILPALLEFAGPRLADGVRVRRICGPYPYGDLSDFERDYFETWNPFGPFQETRSGRGG